ncbi:MAG: SDR family NAD(P)-dependent oxidoreductase [Rhodobacteraceae bacterium]|nr:SDR family NAD(P)-dependent oxidoreductase [Paracoccaceae bacterium]
MTPTYEHALIVGAGMGLSGALARLFAVKGLKVSLAARSTGKLGPLAAETGAAAFPCDAGDQDSVRALFTSVEASPAGAPDVVVYNPSARTPGAFVDLDPGEVERAIRITAYGAFLVAQEAAKRMLPRKHGAILFTGASASVKGYPRSAAFAMGKFAQRGLAQSLARELHPQGVHIGHVNIDGGIRNTERGRVEGPGEEDRWLDPEAIARTYWHFLEQDRSCWSWEVDVRPWVEAF